MVSVGCCAGKSAEGPRKAVAVLQGRGVVEGRVVLEQASINSPVKLRGVVLGLEAGQHGVYIYRRSAAAGVTGAAHECDRVAAQAPLNKIGSGLIGSVKVV